MEVTPFYKGESQEKNLSGDWKERKCSLRFPAHVMLRDSWGFLSTVIHLFCGDDAFGFWRGQAAWL
jgi:hypothetical protein